MLDHIASFIREKALFSKEDQLLLAVSGGMDSMVLLRVLLELGYQPGLVHCNFQLRGDAADQDEAFVQEEAAKHGLDFFSRRFATRQYAEEHQCSIQLAARELRYPYFAELLKEKKYDYLLTAHHLDDRLETFWLNFTRGTGWRGLSSLTAERDHIRRPLLSVNRQQIEAYQQAHQIAYREDESNAEDKYRRNHFRHHVLPALYDWTPDLAERSATNFQQLEEMLLLYEERIAQYRSSLIQEEGARVRINLAALRQHPAAATLSWELLSPYGFNTEQVRQLLTAKAGTLLQSATHTLLIEADEAILQTGTASADHLALNWPEHQRIISLPQKAWISQTLAPVPPRFRDDPFTAWVNPQELIWPLTIRFWQEGDRFAPLGMGGQQQKLQDFFINNKIDRLQRQQVPLLVNGDGAIIWIVGYRQDERFKVSSGITQAVCFALRAN